MGAKDGHAGGLELGTRITEVGSVPVAEKLAAELGSCKAILGEHFCDV